MASIGRTWTKISASRTSWPRSVPERASGRFSSGWADVPLVTRFRIHEPRNSVTQCEVWRRWYEGRRGPEDTRGWLVSCGNSGQSPATEASYEIRTGDGFGKAK